MGVLSAIPRWILVVLLVVLRVYLVGMARLLTIGEGADAALPEFITGLAPSPPPVPPDDVLSPCRGADQLVLAGAGACEVRVEPADGYRRLTLAVTEGLVSIIYRPDDGEVIEPQTLPREGDARAEFGIPGDEALHLVLRCVSLSCALQIEARGDA